MPIPATGNITLAQIQAEFGGASPTSLNEYYRGGAYVPNTARNFGIPSFGVISLSNFRSSSKTVVVSYDIIGGGGTGGYGVGDGGGSGRAPSGGASAIAGVVQAAGGLGGANGVYDRREITLRTGRGSDYGPGGAAGGNRSAGGNAPSTSYGAGGGGGGGDAGGAFDSAGNGGEGGFAGQRLTGTFTVVYGTVITVIVGASGGASGGQFAGGYGANGFCRLTFDGRTLDFYSTQNYTII